MQFDEYRKKVHDLHQEEMALETQLSLLKARRVMLSREKYLCINQLNFPDMPEFIIQLANSAYTGKVTNITAPDLNPEYMAFFDIDPSVMEKLVEYLELQISKDEIGRACSSNIAHDGIVYAGENWSFTLGHTSPGSHVLVPEVVLPDGPPVIKNVSFIFHPAKFSDQEKLVFDKLKLLTNHLLSHPRA